MEFNELFVPPELADDYAAEVLTRLFGGIISQLHGNGDLGIAPTNWLEAIFTVFNSFCLLAMLGVLTYTIYTMIFDTAADGKTFGQQANTRYTILRTLSGVIGFVPVAGGYSLAQVAFLWLLLQGSAFADVTWGRIASEMLDGSPLVSGSLQQIPANQATLVGEFGRTFDTLVTGHLCALNANRIEAILAGNEAISEEDISTLRARPHNEDTPEGRRDVAGGGGPMQEFMFGPYDEVTSSFWRTVNGEQMVEMSHLTLFDERNGSASYGSRDNYCGGVSISDSFVATDSGESELTLGAVASRAQGQFNHLALGVMPGLSDDAYDVAWMIFEGERDAETLLSPSSEAVYDAVRDYLAGPATSSAIISSVVSEAHAELTAMVSEEGWMMAPIWQRGVATTVSAIEMSGNSLEVETVRENRVSAFLRGQGYRIGYIREADSSVREMLAKADIDQDTWDEVAGYIRDLGLPGVDTPSYVSMEDNSNTGLSQRAINAAGYAILDFFSPVASAMEEGNLGLVDPMLQVQRQGAVLATTGAGILGGGAALGLASDMTLRSEVLSSVTAGMTSIGAALFLFGLIMTVVLPLVPTIYFYTAVMSWLLQALEAMFAIPLAILQLFTLSREPTLIGRFSQVLLTVFSVFLRPFFMVVGLVLAMMVISVSLGYLHSIFSHLMFIDAHAGTDMGGGLGALVLLDGVTGIVSLVAFLALYVLCAFLTVLYGSQIVSEFGEYAMNLIGVASSRYTQVSNIADKTALAGGLSYAGARNIGGSLGATQQRAIADKGRLISK